MRREAAHAGELGPKIRGEPADHPAAPPLVLSPVPDEPADPPVQADQLDVDHEGGLHPRGADLRVHLLELRRSQRAVPGWLGRPMAGSCWRVRRLVLRVPERTVDGGAEDAEAADQLRDRLSPGM